MSFVCFSSSKKPKKRTEGGTATAQPSARPRPRPRLTLFDEEVDPDQELFSPGKKLSPQGLAEDEPSTDRKYPGVCPARPQKLPHCVEHLRAALCRGRDSPLCCLAYI